MLKAELKEFLKDQVAEDALYLEEVKEVEDGFIYELSVWSASAGYTYKMKRKVKADYNRHKQKTRDMFKKQVMKELEKFMARFDYTEDPLEGLEVLFNDGFIYDDEV